MNFALFIFCCTLTIFESNDKLIFAMIHFRHGARMPFDRGEDYEFGGKWDDSAQLTGTGQRMLYLLGLRNRIRYINEKKLLSEKYNSSELYIICSLYDRTFVSLSAHLQGLYPQEESLGEKLTEVQLERSDPPVNVTNSRILEEKNKLKNNALPNSMTLIPFESIDILNINACSEKKERTESHQGFGILLNEFNEKYLEKFKKCIENKNFQFRFPYIYYICDSYISNYVDGRNMTKLSSEGINLEEFYDYCQRLNYLTTRERMIDTNETTYIRGTYFMELLLNYTKLRIDQDNGKNISNTTKIPKMVIISGNDDSLVSQELFLILALGNKMDLHRNPTFASQMSFEITRNDDNKENTNYRDYFINYYFNDELIYNSTLAEFINIIEPNLWTDEQINNYCKSNTSDSNQSNTNQINNGNNTNNQSNENDSQENNSNYDNNQNNTNNENIKIVTIKKNKYYTAPLIVFTSLFAISAFINVFTITKLLRRNPNQIDHKSGSDHLETTKNSINLKNN